MKTTVMEYPLQDFDREHETEFLLEPSSNHGSDMDVHTIRSNRNPRRRKSLSSSLCGWVKLNNKLFKTSLYN